MKKSLIVKILFIGLVGFSMPLKILGESMHAPQKNSFDYVAQGIKTVFDSVVSVFKPKKQVEKKAILTQSNLLELNVEVYQEHHAITLAAYKSVEKTLKALKYVQDKKEKEVLLEILYIALINADKKIIKSNELQQIADDIYNKHINK